MVTPGMREDGPLSEGQLFDLIASERRRRVVAALEEGSAPLGIDELAREIARRECEGTPSEERATEVHLALVHVHLPKLEAGRVIAHDRERSAIARGSRFDPVASLAEAAAR
jgi:DNA-binding transcriptional ArsR family regulator